MGRSLRALTCTVVLTLLNVAHAGTFEFKLFANDPGMSFGQVAGDLFITTVGTATSFETATGIVGTFNGLRIASLLPTESATFFNPDNLIQTTPGYVTSNGLGFTTDDGTEWVVFQMDPSGPPQNVGVANDAGTIGSFVADFSSVTTAVPEPGTSAMLVAGLLLVGGIAQRRKTHGS